MRSNYLLAFAVSSVAVHAAESRQGMTHRANPIRKVVTMMQAMQAKVEAEGEKEKDLFDKYMCYCKNGGGTLAKSIADAETKAPALTAAIEEGTGKLAQLKNDIKGHQADRSTAKTAMDEATALRQKEASEYAATSADLKTNIAAISKAVAALEKGMGNFLQTQSASVLKKIVMAKQDMQDIDRQDILAFLSDSSDYSPASGEITGILKTMEDEMSADLADATKQEEAAIADHEGLMGAKTKEVNALTKMIEDKLQRIGDLSVEIQQMKNDLGDTADSLADDKKFLADLDKNCEEKQKLFNENVKLRQQELLALAETIKVLNDDDALDLFKKTLPGAGSSFLQIQVSSAAMRSQALAMLRQSESRKPQIDFIMLSLRGKKVGFDKVIGLIDNLVAELKKEQTADDDKKEYCKHEFDITEDKHKELTKTISDLEKAIAESEESIISTKADIESLDDGIRALDKSVTEATEQRKEENEDYTALLASDSAAKELLGFAKNRLNKFYNPKLYKAPVKTLSDEDRATLAAGGTLAPTEAPGGIAGTGIGLSQTGAAPPPPPESFGAYAKKSEESNGVISLIDLLIKDLEKELTEAKMGEKDAQADYEKMLTDAKVKRAEDSKTLTDKEGALADLDTALGQQKGDKGQSEKQMGALIQYTQTLHTDCDFLIKYFDMRKEARDQEIDSLGKAKAVLSGADFSLLQAHTSRARKFLRHH